MNEPVQNLWLFLKHFLSVEGGTKQKNPQPNDKKPPQTNKKQNQTKTKKFGAELLILFYEYFGFSYYYGNFFSVCMIVLQICTPEKHLNCYRAVCLISVSSKMQSGEVM